MLLIHLDSRWTRVSCRREVFVKRTRRDRKGKGRDVWHQETFAAVRLPPELCSMVWTSFLNADWVLSPTVPKWHLHWKTLCIYAGAVFQLWETTSGPNHLQSVSTRKNWATEHKRWITSWTRRLIVGLNVTSPRRCGVQSLVLSPRCYQRRQKCSVLWIEL